MKKKFLVIGSFFVILLICLLGFSFGFKKELTIDEILETKSYSYLSPKVKQYIKDHYEETGELLLTKENAKAGELYLSPAYIYYLDSSDENKGAVPNKFSSKNQIVGNGNNTDLPRKYDMRNVNGHNYVSPIKDQGVDGICWAYAVNAVLESYYLKQGITRFFSEQQLNYATSNNGVELEVNDFVINQHYSYDRGLGDGAFISTPLSILIDGIGAVDTSWELEHKEEIKNRQKIAAYDVYNFDNSQIEVDEAIIFEYDPMNLTESEKKEVQDVIKEGIMEYGGASVSIYYDPMSKVYSRYNNSDIVAHQPLQRSNHALQLIGWDDDYQYGFCEYNTDENGVVINNGKMRYVNDKIEYYCDDYNGGNNIEGKGAWIFKNSWGDIDQFIYVTYETYINQVAFITKYDTRSWDNSYDVSTDWNVSYYIGSNEYSNNYNFSFKNEYLPNEEKISKIKINSLTSYDFELYISNDNGQSYNKINSYTREFPGYMMIDLSNDNYLIDNNTVIEILSKNPLEYDTVLHVYTENIDTLVNVSNTNYTYGPDNEDYNQNDYVDIYLKEHFKNVSNHTLLNIKIKDNNGVYLPSSAYAILNNYTYMNMMAAKVRIYSNYFQKGTYTVEIFDGNSKIGEHQLNILVDFLRIQGDGSKDNPWQITNPRHINTMRKHPYDYYIIKNDIDFEYDTQNENGLFYNNGEGFKAIEKFYGDLNGNNKTISNLFTTTGFIDKYKYYINNSLDYDDVVGVHDLVMYKETINSTLYYVGGIVNYLSVESKQDINFNNLKMIDSVINVNTYNTNVGGVIGSFISANTNGFGASSSSSFNDWYSNSIINIQTETANIGGFVGSIDTFFANNYISFGNMLFEGSINLMDGFSSANVSDLSGYLNNHGLLVEFNVINFIGNGKYNYNGNAQNYGIVSSINNADEIVDVRHAYTNLPLKSNMKNSDATFNAKPYEIANGNYDNWHYYTRAGYAYFEEPENRKTKEYLFVDHWYQNSDDGIKRIPVLKGIEKEYTTLDNAINLRIGDTVQLENITNNTETAHIAYSLACNLDVCNNTSDNEVISIENNVITGLKKGTTVVIYYNDLDGYIKSIPVNVVDDNEYVIYFDANNGLLENNIVTLKQGDMINYPVPTREHYNFLGWYRDIDGNNSYTEETFNESENVTLYAKWELNGYIINFDSNGGNYIDSIIVPHNATIDVLPVPVKRGNDFIGWYTINNTQITEETVINSSLDVTARWKKTDYYIRYETDGAYAVNSTRVHYDEVVGELPIPEKDGYIFKGWFFTTEYFEELTETYLYEYSRDITVYALFEETTYLMHYDTNGGYVGAYNETGELIEKKYDFLEYGHGDTIQYLAVPYHDNSNKIFLGWFSERVGGERYNIGDKLTSDINLYAHWADEAYQIHLWYTGDSWSMQTIYLELNSKFGALPVAKRDGYEFLGWYDSYEDGNEVTSDTIFSDVNKNEIYTKWKKVSQYTVSFDANGGDEISTVINIQNGYTYGDLPNPNKMGYGFLGWFTKKNGGTRISRDDVFNLSYNQVLYAHWLAPDLYRISLDSNGGNAISDVIERYPGELYGSLPVPSWSNHTFIGWYDDINGGSRIETDTIFDGNANQTLYAHWKDGLLSECVISFDTNGSSPIEPIHLFTGDNLVLPNVTKIGYTFINWTYNGDIVTENTSFEGITSATLIANWRANEYVVRFDANGGNGEMADLTVTYDKAFKLPENDFRKEEYSFIGWSKTSDGDVLYDTYSEFINITDSGIITLYAVWQEDPKITKVYFDIDGAILLDDYFYEPLYLYDYETIYYFPNLKKDGYTLINWTYNGEVIDSETTFYNLGEITIKANWQANNYTVKFDANGGTGTMNESVLTYDNETKLPKNQFTNNDKIFVGWSRIKDGNVEYLDEEIAKNIAMEGEITLYAHWKDNDEHICTVFFDGNGGLGDTRQVYLYGDEKIYHFPELTRKGYNFINWTSNGNIVDTNTSFTECNEITIKANWQAKKYTVKFDPGIDEVQGTMNDIEMTYDVEQQLPLNAFTYEGMVFIGWNAGGFAFFKDGEVVKNIIEEGEITLVADWREEIDVTTLVFDANGGVGDTSSLMIFDGTIYDIDILPTLTRAGYKFVNWTYNDNPVTAYTDFTGIREAKLVANWQANDYIIKYNANGGKGAMNDLIITYDITKNLSTNTFTKDGYRFIGWSKTENGTVEYQDKEAIKNLATEGEVTLYAVWELIPIITGNISFDPNGGLGDMMYINTQEKINLPGCTFAYPGYRFIGWSKEKNGKVIYNDAEKDITDLTENTILYAIWEKNNTDIVSYVDDVYIQRSNENMPVADYIKYLNIGPSKDLKIYNRYGKEDMSSLIGTGYITKIFQDEKLISTRVNIVKGDVTGDGISNIADVKKIADYTLTGNGMEYFDIYASEVTNDEIINIADVKRIADHTLNKEIDLWK